jgi:hypothetical protein
MGLLGQAVSVGVRVLWWLRWARHRFCPYPRQFGFYYKMNPAAGEIVLANARNWIEIYSKITKIPCLWSAMYKDPFPCLVLPLGCSHLNVFIDRTQFCLHVISWPLEKSLEPRVGRGGACAESWGGGRKSNINYVDYNVKWNCFFNHLINLFIIYKNKKCW